MNKILLAGVALSMFVAFQAKATDLEYYVGVKAGFGQLDTKLEGEPKKDYDAVSVIPSFGVRFNKYLRAELEYGVHGIEEEETISYGSSFYKDEIESYTHSGLIQLYADLPNPTILTPFVNAGFGVSWTEWEGKERDSLGNVEKDEGDDTSFTWNVGAGVSAKVTDRLSVDAAYRYSDFGKIEDTEFTESEFLLGFRYSF